LRLTLPRPSHPAPNVRDDREPPLFSSAGQAKEATDWGQRKTEYFCEHDWTTQIALNPLTKLNFTRTPFSARPQASATAQTKIYGTGIGGRSTDDICSPCCGGGPTGSGSG
jgi:hypothetical protein